MTLPKRIMDDRPKKQARLRCPGHLAFVRKHHCVVPGCDRRPIEACHVRKGADGGTGLKPSDSFVYSGCSHHHAESHRIGEVSFQKKYGIDLLGLAAEFAKASEPLRRCTARQGRT